jgi:hypothetical protein
MILRGKRKYRVARKQKLHPEFIPGFGVALFPRQDLWSVMKERLSARDVEIIEGRAK